MARRPGSRPGGSLVEVLVALAVLLIGIFGIARLFPQGFGSLRYTERLTNATSLAQKNEEFLRARAQNLPDAIVALLPGTNLIDPNLDPRLVFHESPYTGPGLPPNSIADPRYSGPNRWRRVLGEVVRIPPPTTTSPYFPGGAVSLHNLTFSPIYSAAAIPGSSIGIAVYSATPQRRIVVSTLPQDNDDVLPLTADQNSYGINYDIHRLYFAAVPQANADPAFQGDRTFKLEYTYLQLDPGGNVVRATSVPDLILTIPWKEQVAGRAWNEFDLPPPVDLPAGFGWKIELGSDFLYRAFRDTTGAVTPFSSTDPYEYRVLNSLLGVVGFNPLGANIPQPHSAGRGIVAKIDYDVDDWHILHEDLIVPTEPDPVIRLAAGPVKKIGDPEDILNLIVDVGGNVQNHTTEYRGLVRGYAGRPSSTDLTTDVIVADMTEGVLMTNADLDGVNGKLNYQNGTIRFNPTVQWRAPGSGAQLPAESIAGKHIRVYYRSRADWGMSVEKPHSNYLRESVALANMDHREYMQGSGGFLFFPITDGGKSVLVDYSWQQFACEPDPANPGSFVTVPVERTEVGELHRIGEPATIGSPQNPPFGQAVANWWVRLNNHDSAFGVPAATDPPSPAPFPTSNCSGSPIGTVVPGTIQVLGVRGASLTSLVFWREGNDWRQVQQVTILGRDTR